MSLAPCIFCRRTEVERSTEHVLQHALGAVATLPTEVCAECNSSFSAIDKHFVDAVEFYHLGKNMFRQLGLGRVVQEDGLAVAARLLRDGRGAFPPQLLEVSPKNWRVITESEEQLHQVLAELKEPDILVVTAKVTSGDDGTPTLAIIRSRPRCYLVEGNDEGRVERLCAELRTKGMQADQIGQPSRGRTNSGTPMTFPTSLHLEPYCRAMAKVALNFICYRLGASVALRPELDAVRAFAREGSGTWSDFVLPTLLNNGMESAMAAFFMRGHHGLFLWQCGKVAVFVVLGGQTVGRVDLIQDGGDLLVDGGTLLSRFDPEEHTVEDFSLPSDMPQAVVNPTALGMEGMWPKEWPS